MNVVVVVVVSSSGYYDYNGEAVVVIRGKQRYRLETVVSYVAV